MSANNLAFDMDEKVSKSNDVTTEIKTPDEEVDHPLQDMIKWLVASSAMDGCTLRIMELKSTSCHQTNQTSNLYVIKRNFIHQLMDVALMMANVSQLKALLELSSKDKYFYLLLVVIVLSISLQVIFTICMLIIWSIENGAVGNIPESSTEITENGLVLKDNKVANVLDKVGNVLVLCIIVANVFIIGFGVEPHGPVNSSADNTPA